MRLTDRTNVPVEYQNVGTVLGGLTDRAHVDRIVHNVDVVVHLAAYATPWAHWAELHGPNVEGAMAVLDAAARNGVRRVILASSIHGAGRYVVAEKVPVRSTWPAAPCCLYGATKAWGELVGQAYAHQTGMSVIRLRLGATQPEPTSPASLTNWLGPNDLQALIRCCIGTDVAYGVYNGVSANTRTQWDIADATADLGYVPGQDSETFADQVGRTNAGPRAAGTLAALKALRSPGALQPARTRISNPALGLRRVAEAVAHSMVEGGFRSPAPRRNARCASTVCMWRGGFQ